MTMCRDEAMDTLDALAKGDPLAACDIEAIDVVRAEVARLRAAVRNRALAVRAAQGIDLHRPRYTGMSPGDGVEATADAIQAVYRQAAEAEGGGGGGG